MQAKSRNGAVKEIRAQAKQNTISDLVNRGYKKRGILIKTIYEVVQLIETEVQ